jgi:predicted RNA binding protein with dsRBD fold (UPF0201 family)
MKCKIEAETHVYPTEDLNKVIIAFSNVFDYEELEIGKNYVLISGGCSTLAHLKEFLEKKKIRDTARRIFLKGAKKNNIIFKLSKQAAYAGRINLVEENLSPLGEIQVQIKTIDPEKTIEWLCKH